MKVHIYDFLNKNKLALVDASAFTSININQNIDDFSSCIITHTINEEINNINLQGFENMYVEDDKGNIIFGGILVGFNVTARETTMQLYDHRWVLSRLVLDTAITLSSSDQILDVVELLLAQAKAKRQIPLEFDREASAINTDFSADLKFEIGDDIGSCLQKIIQTVYARWAVRYFKVGNEIYGSLRVRSVRGVTPEGIGISRGNYHSEDGTKIILKYGEGEDSNIQDFNFNFDMANYASRAKVGTKIADVAEYVTALPDGTSGVYEFYFGRAEVFTTDYKANSKATAQALSTINQNYPKIDVEVFLSPEFEEVLNPGDRVSIVIDSPMLTGVNGNLVRIDAASYVYKDGYLERKLSLNFMSPQKRAGTVGLLQAISQIQQKLDGLDKSYLNS